MVIAKVGFEVIKRGIAASGRFARYDKAAWNKLYTGFPKYVKKGTREGFIAGTSIGGFLSGVNDINDDGTDHGDAFQKKNVRPKTRQSYKERNRRFGTASRRRCKCNPRRYYRRSSY